MTSGSGWKLLSIHVCVTDQQLLPGVSLLSDEFTDEFGVSSLSHEFTDQNVIAWCLATTWLLGKGNSSWEVKVIWM